MRASRITAVILAAVFAAVTIFGFLAQSSLTDDAGFSESLEQSMSDPATRQELASEVAQAVSTSLNRVVQEGGVAGAAISAVGVDNLASRVGEALSSPEATAAFTSWLETLHDGLAADALGTPDDNVSVSGSTVSVKLSSLITPILTNTPIGGLSGVAQSVLGDTSVSIDVGFNLERRLQLAGAAANARWAMLVLTAVLVSVAVFLGPARWRWFFRSLFFMGLSVLLLAGVILLLEGSGSPQLPALTDAIMSATTQGGIGLAGAIGAGLIIIGALGWFFMRGPSPTATSQTTIRESPSGS